MLAELRLRVQPPAGIVEVDVILSVEPAVLAGPQILDGLCVGIPVG